VESEKNTQFLSTENAFHDGFTFDLTKEQIEEIVMKDEKNHSLGRTPNKVIIVPGKIINFR
jgi:leucyl-tRNA synthetase